MSHWVPQGWKQVTDPVVDCAPRGMVSNVSPAPYVISASSAYNGTTLAAFNAFNSDAASYWLGTGSGTDWLKVDLGVSNAQFIHSYSITANTVPEATRMPKNWTLQGSNDDSAWTVLDTRVNETTWGSGETRNYACNINSSMPFRYYKLNITANNGDATYTQVAELYLYADYRRQYLTTMRDRVRMTGISKGSYR